MYVIIAPIQIKAGFKEQFIAAVTEDARSSVANEPGCLRFDVIQDATGSIVLATHFSGGGRISTATFPTGGSYLAVFLKHRSLRIPYSSPPKTTTAVRR